MERGGARPALRPARLRSELDRVLSGAVQRFSGSSVQRLPMFFFFFSSLHIRAARVPGFSVRSGTKVEQGSFRLRCCNISPSLLLLLIIFQQHHHSPTDAGPMLECPRPRECTRSEKDS